MRIVLQRVKSSQVVVDGNVIGKIGRGLNLLVGISDTDSDSEIDWMARKCLDLRLFPGENTTNWNYSVQEIQGEILVVSQFTLYGDCRKGRRPSFSQAASPDTAKLLYERFVEKLKATGLKIETGEFGANMQISLENDGPVTLFLEREAEK
ncbi:MAG: D-aminoacyl-tRNA deacylase [Halothece sp.]